MEFRVTWPDKHPAFKKAMKGVECLDLTGIGATTEWYGDRVRVRLPKPYDHLTLTHEEDLTQDVDKAITVYQAFRALGARAHGRD
jgi:hypothetical protein